jgi:glutaredoxin-like protein
MIPLREQEYIQQHFAEQLEGRVKIDYFTQRASQLIVPGREQCATCEETRTFLEEVAALSDKITLTVRELADEPEEAKKLKIDKVPGIVIRGPVNRALRYFGLPAGNEFPAFIEAIVLASKQHVDLAPEVAKQLKRLKDDMSVVVYVTPTCGYCPSMVRSAYRLALSSAKLGASVVEIGQFPRIAQQLGIRAVPFTVINDRSAIPGAMDEAALLEAIMKVAEGSAQVGPASASGATSVASEAPSPSSGLVLPR